MGYECILHYHEELDKGVYDKENLKTKSIKVGTPYENISLEQLAGKIMSQFARRNILIVNVEIFEFEKKKISFKETNDGILIKNRKFNFDDDNLITNVLLNTTSNIENESSFFSEEEVVKAGNKFVEENPAIVAKIVKNPNSVNIVKKPIRYEIFYPPEKFLLEQVKNKKLTLNKEYAIYEETPGANFYDGMNYLIKDDEGNFIKINDRFFIPKTVGIDVIGFKTGEDSSDLVIR
jgi:hypothetical protein